MIDAALQGTWVVLRYLVGDELVEPIYGGDRATLLIDGERFAGTMGVNRFTGRLRDGFPKAPLAVTRMAGPPDAMAQEDALLRHLEETDHLEVDETGIRMSRNGFTTVEFHRPGTDRGRRSS